MAVAKRQGREMSEKKNRTKEGPRTRVRTSGKQTAVLASPIYIGQAQGEEKKHIKGGAKVLSHGLSLPHACALFFLSLSLSLSLLLPSK